MMQVFEFLLDGVLNILFPITEEMRADAEKDGMTITEDGYAIIDTTVWKEQGGKFFYDSGIEGEILGETIDPFEELKITPEGYLLYDYESWKEYKSQQFEPKYRYGILFYT